MKKLLLVLFSISAWYLAAMYHQLRRRRLQLRMERLLYI